MKTRQVIRRKRYLIATRFQLKYAFMIIVFMFLIAWLAGYTVYYTAFSLLGEKLANVYPQGKLAAILRTANIALTIRIVLLIPFVIVMSIFLSHRVAGPVFRMERYLGEIAQGDFSSILKLRTRDELKNLAETINKMTSSLGRMAQESQGLVIKISGALDEINAELKKPAPDQARVRALAGEASGYITDLKDRFSRYRIREEAAA